MDEQIMDFYQKHLSGWDPETGESRCPVCGSPGFKVTPDGGFECPRGNLSGDTPEDFIEQVGAWRLHHLRRIVREGRNRELLEAQGLSRDEIAGRVVDMEKQRDLVWNAIARKTLISEITKEGAEERTAESLESLDDLIKIVAQELKRGEGEIKAVVDDLIEFRDLEVGESENHLRQKVTKIRVRYLWRKGAREFLTKSSEG
jgi:hypothetical protein